MSWLNASWDYRVKITVDNTKVDSNLSNFPVYVDLSDLPAGFHANVKSDGGDIRVTTSDGETEVPREVVFYDSATDTGELHFKGNVDSDTNTDFYIYYGNAEATEPAVDSTYGRNNVWTGYSCVLHLQEDGNTSADGYVDSSGNGNDGTGTGMDSADDIAAQIGKGSDFDNTKYITVGGYSLGTTWTIQGWIKHDTGTADQALVGNAALQFWRDEYATGDRYGIAINDGGWKVQYGTTIPDTSNGYLVGMAYNAGSSQLYVNGGAEGSALSASYSASNVLLLGRGDSTTSKPHDG